MFKKMMNKLSQNQVSVEFYIKKMHDSFTEDVAFRYPDEESYGSEYDYIESITKDYLQKEKNYIAPEIMMTRLRSWYFDNAYYQLVKQKDSEKALEYYAKSSYYGFLAIYINYSAIKCQFPYRVNYYSYSLVTAYLSQCLIAGYDKEFSEILELFYASIKYKNLSREEYVNQHNTIYLDFDTDRFGVVWFLYRLFYKTKETDIQIETEYKLDNFYQQVIDNWDTQDLMKVDKLVYMLSEVHIDQTREDTPEEQLNNPFNNPLYWLFPYEILVWLKLREHAGLSNPKTFSHPLMNTPIAKFFLSLETPLPKPSTLPFAKELLSKLKEQCPNVEIPEWIDAMETSEGEHHPAPSEQTAEPEASTSTNPIIRSNEIVPQSGVYQASLPIDHPLAQTVHHMPQSQQLGVEGVTLLPLGLDPTDEEQLRWEWIRA